MQRLIKIVVQDIAGYKQAIHARPDYAEAHHILGFMYLIPGNRNAALEQYRILNGLDKDLADELFKYIESISPLDHSTNSLLDQSITHIFAVFFVEVFSAICL